MIEPVGFDAVIIASVICCGHLKRNTVGGTAEFSPITIPPQPCADASVMPTKSGHAGIRLQHIVGVLTESCKKKRQSFTDCKRSIFCAKLMTWGRDANSA